MPRREQFYLPSTYRGARTAGICKSCGCWKVSVKIYTVKVGGRKDPVMGRGLVGGRESGEGIKVGMKPAHLSYMLRGKGVLKPLS